MSEIKDIKDLSELPDNEEIAEVIIERGDIAYRLHVRALTHGEWLKVDNDEPLPDIDMQESMSGNLYNFDTPHSRRAVGRRTETVRLKRIVASICEKVPGGDPTKLATNEQVDFLKKKFGDQGIYKLEVIIGNLRTAEANSIMLAERFHAGRDTGDVGDGEVGDAS